MGIRAMRGVTALVLSLLFGAPIAGAQVYRWTDAGGRVHFSDRAPADAPGDIREIDVPVAPVQPDPELQLERERGRKLLEVWSAERRQQAEDRRAALAREQQHDQRCAQLRAYLEEIRRARYLVRNADSGQQIALPQAERSGYEQQLRELLAGNCA